ncbi:MAG: hypothetical protein KKD44_28690 [Proteobacteria bacterium]|nr:hypothetical protein [Pseudomonadota bacterium]
MRERFFSKITSGKFIMTVAITITLCVLALQGKVGTEDFMKLALIVAYAYFTKDSMQNGGSNGGNGTNIH